MSKRPVAKKPTWEAFYFFVRRPSAYYNISLQAKNWDDDPYEEMLSLTFEVECLSPKRCQGRITTAHFFPDPNMDAGSDYRRRPREKPKAVGSIIVGKNRFEVGGSLPPDVCWRLGAAMASGTVTSMIANGQWPRPGHGYLTSISFHGPDLDIREAVGEP